MYLLCADCGAEHKGTGRFCSECGSQKFIKQDLSKKYLSRGVMIASRYKIIEFLQKGGMGAVYKAEDTRLSKICAVKELINTSLDEKERLSAVKRFEREAKILSELQHPNLPRVIDYFTIGERHYLAMDFIDGVDLGEFLKSSAGARGLSEEAVAEWAIQVCNLLSYLHSRKPPIVYRDIKPSNIMIRNSDRRVILIDFGIARTVAPKDEESLTKTAIGTMGYMAPEQYKGRAEARSDIYGLGATMYHLLTGKAPIPFGLEPVKNVKPDISPHMNAIVMTAVRLKRKERFQSAEEMRKALLGNIKIEAPVTEEVTQADLLINQLKSPDPNLRYIVLRAIESLEDKTKTIKPLIDIMLNDPDLIVRREAVNILSEINNMVIPDIFNRALSDQDREIKLKAIEVIKKIKDPSSTDALLKALSDRDSEVRISSAMCLAGMKEKKATDKIFELLQRETSPESLEKLEKAIDTIDSEYLNEWRLKKERAELKKAKKKGTGILIYAILFILIICASFITYSHFSKESKVKKFMNEGEKNFREGEYDIALENFNKALEIYPSSPDIMYWLGRTYIYVKPEKSAFYLDKGLSLKPDYAEVFMAKGKLNLVEKKPEEAIKNLEKAIELKADLPPAYIYLGEAYYRAGDKEKTEEILEKNRAVISREEGLSEVADAWLKKMVCEEISQDIKSKVEEKLRQGDFFIEQLDYNSAEKEFQDIITISPDDARGYNGLARIMLLERNNDVAIKYFKKAVECDPVYTEAFCSIALLYLREKNYRESIKYLRMASEIDPGYSEIHYLSGMVYYETDEKEKALNAFKEFLSLSSGGEKAEEVNQIIQKLESEN